MTVLHKVFLFSVEVVRERRRMGLQRHTLQQWSIMQLYRQSLRQCVYANTSPEKLCALFRCTYMKKEVNILAVILFNIHLPLWSSMFSKVLLVLLSKYFHALIHLSKNHKKINPTTYECSSERHWDATMKGRDTEEDEIMWLLLPHASVHQGIIRHPLWNTGAWRTCFHAEQSSPKTH